MKKMMTLLGCAFVIASPAAQASTLTCQDENARIVLEYGSDPATADSVTVDFGRIQWKKKKFQNCTRYPLHPRKPVMVVECKDKQGDAEVNIFLNTAGKKATSATLQAFHGEAIDYVPAEDEDGTWSTEGMPCQ